MKAFENHNQVCSPSVLVIYLAAMNNLHQLQSDIYQVEDLMAKVLGKLHNMSLIEDAEYDSPGMDIQSAVLDDLLMNLLFFRTPKAAPAA